MLTLIDRQSSTCSLFSYTLCSTDVEGFSVQQFDACVEKLIGLETSGNMCTCGCVFQGACASMCLMFQG